MQTSSQVLGTFAASLKHTDIPDEVRRRAVDCIIDTVGAAHYGARLPWAQIIEKYARNYGRGGFCSIIGSAQGGIQAPYAALVNGVLANAFELDSARHPGVGAHPGATLLPAVLAACEESSADGRTAITAFVAGCEVLLRIGKATHHRPEVLGFHGPGVTGPFGSAAAAGHVFGLNSEQLGHALGIAGSLCSGLLAFTGSLQGGMVKRLHLGRAAEAGILAAQLARSGFTGPETILEGKFGFLEVYCGGGEPALLTAGMRDEWETMRVGLKLFPYHVVASPIIQAVRALLAEQTFQEVDVSSVTVECAAKILTHHNIPEPGDLVQAQHSVPFCVALALFLDPADPHSFNQDTLVNPQIRALCRSVVLRERSRDANSNPRPFVTLTLKDGRQLKSKEHAAVSATIPDSMRRILLRKKFDTLTGSLPMASAARLFEKLERLDTEAKFPSLSA